MLLTCTVLIGNSDDKLSQKEWSSFYWEINATVDFYSSVTHFRGTPPASFPYQNACWVFEIESKSITMLKEELTSRRVKYNQDSVAILFGSTQFI